MSIACITGASAGLGASFAEACAARGDDLVLVARDATRLDALAASLHARHGVRVEVLAADLGVPDDVARVAARVADPDRPIDLLVNNAGFGLTNHLLDAPAAEHRHAIDVMCTAVAELSIAAAQAMRHRGHGRILNVASLSAWVVQGNYSAVKAWVKVFTEGLAAELAGTGVTATALCPGWVRTEFHTRAGLPTASIPDWIWVDADTCVTKALADADAGRVLSVPTVRWKLARFGLDVLPRPVVRWISGRLTHSRD
jgi:short-subunit dehydrogenase